MSELREWTASEIEEYDDARLELSEDGNVSCTKLYIKSDADKVIAEKDKEIADLIEKNKRLARKDLIMASETIKDLEESHKKEVEQLLMKIAGLEKLVKTADKLLKPKGGFTIKDITFDGVKLEGLKKEVTNAVDKSNA
jgi:hypothetical protein